MNKSTMQKTNEFLSDMPPWFFWSLLFILTWCFSITKIANLDLWWHLACGRFFIENGFYPPTGTFTFSPVNPTTSNIHTWFGDIILYLIYFTGSEIGLQVFRVVLIFVPLLLFASIARKKYNPWLLAFMVMVVVGTSQMQFLRNSIFGLLFTPLIVWLWWFVKQKGDIKSYCLVFLYVPIMGIWSIMHGYALIGAYIVFLIFAGELLDLFIRKTPDKFIKAGLFFVAVLCMYFVVNMNLSLNITGTLSSFFKTNMNTSVEKIDKSDANKIDINQEKKSFDQNEHSVYQFIKKNTRFLLKGGDVGFIGEYEYPFDHTFLLMVKALILFLPIFVTYLVFSLLFFPGHLRFSFMLPSLAIIIIGMGYIRTVAFPFLVAGPFMASGIFELSQALKNGEIKRFKIPKKNHTNYMITLPMVLLLLFFLLSQYYFLKNNFVAFTGIVSGAPGFGRADRHKTGIPEYVLKNYPDENMYNSYTTGSLLIWEWYGKKKVFLDGRSVTYKKEFYDDFRYTYSFNSLEKMGIQHAILGIADDYDWFEAYFRRNWDIVCFDTGMMLLERRLEEGYDIFYGNVPKFLGKPEDVDKLNLDIKNRFGRFLNVMIEYMLIFGRIEDSLILYDSIEKIVDMLPDYPKNVLYSKKRLMDDVKKEFGIENRAILVDLFKEILLTDKDDRQDAAITKEVSPASIYTAFANVHFQLGNKKKGVDFLSVAADTDMANVSLQIQVADYFYRIKALGPAIKHYERAVLLSPGRVHEYNKLGTLYYQKGDIKASEKYFQKAVEADPGVIESYINLTAIFMEQNKMMEALAINEKGLLLEPENIPLLEMKKQIVP